MPIGKEYQTIELLQEELSDLSNLEKSMKAVDGRNPVQKVIDAYAVTPSLYTDPKKLKDMITALSVALKGYVKSANIKGRLLATKSLERYLSDSEKRDITQRQLRLISQASERQAQRRLSVSLMELQKEHGVLKADIAIFKARQKIAGFSDKEALKQLIIAGKDRNGIVQGFANRIKTINVAAMRRERSAAKITEYKKQAKPKEQWQWITISSKPCPDCEARAGKAMLLSQWERIGLPGSGRTICGAYCKCDLIPYSVAEDLFPTVKVFDWDEKKQVLTTASEARQLRAKSHQPIQKTKK